MQTGKNVESQQLHKGNVMDPQLSKDGTHFITASTDMQVIIKECSSIQCQSSVDPRICFLLVCRMSPHGQSMNTFILFILNQMSTLLGSQ